MKAARYNQSIKKEGRCAIGYFANGEEGRAFQNEFCHNCIHDIEENCPLFAVHLVYNYEQQDKGNEMTKNALEMLVERTDKWPGNKCLMFVQKPDENKPLHCPGCDGDHL